MRRSTSEVGLINSGVSVSLGSTPTVCVNSSKPNGFLAEAQYPSAAQSDHALWTTPIGFLHTVSIWDAANKGIHVRDAKHRLHMLRRALFNTFSLWDTERLSLEIDTEQNFFSHAWCQRQHGGSLSSRALILDAMTVHYKGDRLCCWALDKQHDYKLHNCGKDAQLPALVYRKLSANSSRAVYAEAH